MHVPAIPEGHETGGDVLNAGAIPESTIEMALVASARTAFVENVEGTVPKRSHTDHDIHEVEHKDKGDEVPPDPAVKSGEKKVEIKSSALFAE